MIVSTKVIPADFGFVALASEQMSVVDGGVVNWIVGTVEEVGFTIVLIFIAFNDGGSLSII